MITVKILDIEDIARLGEIDRSEHLTVEYTQDGENLIEKKTDYDVPPWSIEGEGGHSVNRLINGLKPHLEKGAVLLGALDGETLAGIAVLRYESGSRGCEIAVYPSKIYKYHPFARRFAKGCHKRPRTEYDLLNNRDLP